MNSIASNFEEHTLHSYDLAVVYKPSKCQPKDLNQSFVSGAPSALTLLVLNLKTAVGTILVHVE